MNISASGLCLLQSFSVMSLLNMDRDDEAYNILKFRMTTFNKMSYKEFKSLVIQSNPQQWIQPSTNDKKEKELFEVTYKNGNNKYLKQTSLYLAACYYMKFLCTEISFQVYNFAENDISKNTRILNHKNQGQLFRQLSAKKNL